MDEDTSGGFIHNVQTRQMLMQKLSKDTMGMTNNYPSLPSMTTPNPSASTHGQQTNNNNPSHTPMTPYNTNYPMYNNNGGLVQGMTPMMVNQANTIQSNCLLLSNLFDPKTLDLNANPNFFSEISEDVGEECNGYGKVDLLWIDEESIGNIWVKYADNNIQAAKLALDKLNKR